MRRFTSHKLAFSSVLTGACLAITACSNITEDSEEPGPTAATSAAAEPSTSDAGQYGGIPQYKSTPGAAGLNAQFAGTVRISQGCVYVVDGDIRLLPVFPSGSVSWDASRSTFTWRGATYADGSSITLGGSEGRGGPDMDPDLFTVLPDAGCNSEALWIVSP
uniref:hypothetical protein n=1 Tax=Parerythrobacter lutipelagi TaxID=1964208 RepID=UPI0010F8EA78|nr:hypothetical protein [Parerythrobacter lutipelagi]